MQATELKKENDSLRQLAEDARTKLDNYHIQMKHLATDLKEAKMTVEKIKEENQELKKAVLVAGDFNGDGRADVSDAMDICLLLLQEETIACHQEGDANDDGRIDVGDALYIINQSLAGER
jgi:hypothetical protein